MNEPWVTSDGVSAALNTLTDTTRTPAASHTIRRTIDRNDFFRMGKRLTLGLYNHHARQVHDRQLYWFCR
jgi:hypothetical protein